MMNRLMASKPLHPVITKLKAWRAARGLSQSKTIRALVTGGLPIKVWHPPTMGEIALLSSGGDRRGTRKVPFGAPRNTHAAKDPRSDRSSAQRLARGQQSEPDRDRRRSRFRRRARQTPNIATMGNRKAFASSDHHRRS